ncbi:GH92 family glycosyl hydrolase [uncultured Bacteroides sp.]|uniref:GH92 family glycosyl hydrolase n=1 Tax=uncultured Bacteroides sp. TaxID=162156 RepID=UPI002AA7F642|nr:GH92 family glycosyl hydrolase [uncultured Bacteroides sp.]
MKNFKLVGLGILAFFSAVSCSRSEYTKSIKSPVEYVNPMIGSGGHGHVFVGASVPFGFVQLGPTEPVRGWDWCSGYHYSDSTLVGFSHTHLSGTGIGDLGDVLFFPSQDSSHIATFNHGEEKAIPGYYSVVMQPSHIRVELTSTARTGFHRYTFPVKGNASVIVNLRDGIGWDQWTDSRLVQENDSVISGYRISAGWAKHQQVYFVAVFSKPIQHYTATGDSIGTLSFVTDGKSDPLYVKVGLSAVSVDNAKLNLKTEVGSLSFDAIADQAMTLWNNELGRIKVDMLDSTATEIFYTAFYHTMIAPSVFCDVNGDYRGSDGKIYQNGGFVNYTTFSLWDTYRAAHPLATLVHPDRMKDYAETFIHIFKEQGKLPVWHLMGNETDCMVGNPSIPVLADLVLKGFLLDKADQDEAFTAMKTSAMLNERSIDLLKKYGYIPYDKESSNETTSKGLEYALADASVAKVAQLLGKTSDYDYFHHRSESYHYYWDSKTHFMRGVSSTGKFSEPFDPFISAPGKGDYTEGNAWQYAWLVPHDVHGLIKLFGGEKAFVSKLDSLFIVQGNLGKDAAPDVSGLIGQYAHGNEPSHHIIYLYDYAGMPYKAAPRLREVMSTLYKADPDGLCGNEDVGQMSAWYVMSALGLYQVEPAGGIYVFGSPIVKEATLNVGHDRTFKIVAHNNSKDNIYIQSAKLNGKPYTKSYITFRNIVAGGILEFEMGNRTSSFGTLTADRP